MERLEAALDAIEKMVEMQNEQNQLLTGLLAHLDSLQASQAALLTHVRKHNNLI